MRRRSLHSLCEREGLRGDGRGALAARRAAASLSALRARGRGVRRRRLQEGGEDRPAAWRRQSRSGAFSEPQLLRPRSRAQSACGLRRRRPFLRRRPLARLEMATVLPILFDRLPGLKLTEKPCYRDAYHFHGLKALETEWG